MPELDERTPGTTEEPKPDDAADKGAGASGDSPADGSDSEDTSGEDRIAKLQREKEQLLSQKTTWEQDRKRLEQYERERAAPPHPPATGDDAKGRAMLENDLALEREIMAGVQPTLDHFQAKARLDVYRHQLAMDATRKTERRVEIVKLPSDLQDEAEKLADEEGLSVRIAARIIKAERAAQAKADDKDEDDERIQRATAKRDATPRSESRSVTADQAGRFTRTEYNRRLDKFRENDDMRGAANFIKENKSRIRE